MAKKLYAFNILEKVQTGPEIPSVVSGAEYRTIRGDRVVMQFAFVKFSQSQRSTVCKPRGTLVHYQAYKPVYHPK